MRFKRTYITKTALETIKDEILVTRNHIETGGILMGYYSRGDEVVVTHASSPGPKAIQKRRSILFDTEFCQGFVNDVFARSSGYFTYIGDWHSHTLPSLKPSLTDRWELKRMTKTTKSSLPSPIMLIAFASDNEFVSGAFSLSNGLYQIKDTTLLEYDINWPKEGR